MSLSLKPTRVLINVEGEAVTPERAILQGVSWDVIFIRNDGWSLGASNEFAQAANDLWPEEWVALIKDDIVWQY